MLINTKKSKLIISNLQEIIQTENCLIRKSIKNKKSEDQWFKSDSNVLLSCLIVTLFKGKDFSFAIEKNEVGIVLPLIGGLEVKAFKANYFIENECIRAFTKMGVYNLNNPYQTDSIQFLFVKFKTLASKLPTSQKIRIKLENNKMNKIFYSKFLNIKLSIGKFASRVEGIYKVKSQENILCFINLNGTFEVDYKLLEVNDLAVIHELVVIEYEALTNNAFGLILEF